MNCDDFQILVVEVLDARSGPTADQEGRIEAHAASCPPCRSTLIGYQVLRQAIASLPPPPRPSAEATARLLALMAASRPTSGRGPASRRNRPAWSRPALAAALAGVALLGWADHLTSPGPPGPIEPSRHSVGVDRPLGSALADATSASIALAREASGPAARIGREMLEDLDEAEGPSIAEARPDGEESAPPPPDLLQAVGERFNAGVRPISGSARHAFSFLLGPAPAGPAGRPAATQDSL